MIAVGFFLGTVVTALLCLRTLRRLTVELDAARRAARDLSAELRAHAPVHRPSDISRTARSQEDTCSSSHSSAA